MGVLIRAALLGLMATPAGAQTVRPPELSYRLTEGQNLNSFVRDGPVAAHLLLRNGADPRILVAFPAGNSGVGLWFDRTTRPVTWTLAANPTPVTLMDAKGRALHGIRAVATINADRLVPKQAVLSNVRYLRDYQAVGRFPAEVTTTVQASGNTLLWSRDRIDGAAGYLLQLRVIEGRVENGAIVAGPGGRIRIDFTAASGDPPLTGLSSADLFTPIAAADPKARNALRFLSYREKFLAGSWRFNTYFGRDTLMSVAMLMPVLKPAATEAGLNAVLERLNAQGEVSHEEGIGEFAVLENRKAGRATGDAPDLDYKMVDDNFMLAPVMAMHVLDQLSPAAARAYLARRVPMESAPGTSETVGALLVRNLRFVATSARPFAADPRFDRLIELKTGFPAGQWRDSDDGIGGGRYAYDVNAVLVPAALRATERFVKVGLLDGFVSADDRALLAEAGSMAARWESAAPPLFRVVPDPIAAYQAAIQYGRSVKSSAPPAYRTPPRVEYHAISLRADGSPVPIIHSDEAFMLFFGMPKAPDLDALLPTLMRDFPEGLMTPVGMLIANPVNADAKTQAKFNPGAYHGVVVWSWQQALMAEGMKRQLSRPDLPAATRATLTAAQGKLWRAIEAARPFANSELWTWAYEGGKYKVVAFGAGRTDVDESNAAQLWSTVYLAVRPPNAQRGSR